jgi:hypothetical protein
MIRGGMRRAKYSSIPHQHAVGPVVEDVEGHWEERIETPLRPSGFAGQGRREN